VHQIRAISLYSYLDVARFLGIDGLQLLTRVGIAPEQLNDPDARLPAEPVVRLLEESARESRCDSFGIRMAQCRTFSSLGPISLLLERVANIGEALQALQNNARALSDLFHITVSVTSRTVSAAFEVVPPFNREQASALTVGLGCVALSGASGGRWHPQSVHFTQRPPKDRRSYETFFRAPLVFDSNFNGFSFHESDLGIALPLADAAMAQNAAKLLSGIDLPALLGSVADHARHSIALLLPEGRASVKNVADNLDLGPRALQRRLKSEGHSFEALLNDYRRSLVQRLLRTPQERLADTALAIGYSDQTAFTRWFRTEFRMSPTAWQKAERAPSQIPPPVWKVGIDRQRSGER